MPPSPAAMKARIIKHMNDDHAESLQLYLQHYASLPASSCKSPVLQDVTLTSMTIESSPGNLHTIPLSPPAQEWKDYRAVVVKMDASARAALGLPALANPESEGADSHNVKAELPELDRFIPPTLFQTVGLAAILLFLLSSVLYRFIVPGTWFYDGLLQEWFPGGGEGYRWALRTITPIVGILHVGEMWVLDGMLKRVGVKRGSRVWWMWIVSDAFEGWACIVRVAEWERVWRKGKKE